MLETRLDETFGIEPQSKQLSKEQEEEEGEEREGDRYLQLTTRELALSIEQDLRENIVPLFKLLEKLMGLKKLVDETTRETTRSTRSRTSLEIGGLEDDSINTRSKATTSDAAAQIVFQEVQVMVQALNTPPTTDPTEDIKRKPLDDAQLKPVLQELCHIVDQVSL